MKRELPLIATLLALSLPLQAQEPPRPPIDLEEFAERLFPLQEEDLPYEDLYEQLLLLYTQPLDLNRASREELQALYLLKPAQVASFMHYREQNGPLLSLYELQAIPAWDLTTIQQLLPFVRVRDLGLQGDSRPLLEQLRHSGTRFAILRWERQLEQQAGYRPRADTLNPAYAGSADKLYLRLRMSKARSFSLGLTAEKDAGEALRVNSASRQYGADFYSIHAMFWNLGPFKRLVLGDYQLQAGQGLVLGAGFYLGKGAETITTVGRASLGLRPYTSVVEGGYFRGAGFSLGNQRAELTLFGSSAARDASLRGVSDSLSLAEDRYFSALQSSGLHRTASELANRHAVRESNLGLTGRWKVAPGQFSLGFTSLYTHFNTRQQPQDHLYNRFAFRGKENWTGSLFAEGRWQQLSYFTEWALSQGGGWGSLTGLIAPLSHGLDVSLLFRNYTPTFYSFYGAAFAEGSRLQNETGLYWGLKYRHSRALWFTAYFDHYWFPWLRYRVSAPSQGHDYLLRANWQPSRSLLLYFQYRGKLQERDAPGGDKSRAPAPLYRRQYILNLDHSPLPHLQFRSRVQWSRITLESSTSRGYLLVQDISYSLGRWRLSSRYALFDTDDWESRQYAMERDVLWAFSVPAYYGKGSRYYALLQWKVLPNLDIWLRWARTHFRDREQIGSGHARIEGPHRSQIKMQLKLDF
ncbi:ComEA family DNA-binding protein [Cesiribacter andamanensis]|uniref:Helix-hairpin-helix motif protein n=1 Tax=Cesiribacter andamanensis AMV16 TaxID=1279009 RepID=M7N6F5_9BACT|nr:helix-hairpin-helix domain-containing protein [Cesiribacter andamanensis]EMR02796.1 hypothetical protein ADICEAN_02071 [Cesiribacter andamanensis AMV16]